MPYHILEVRTVDKDGNYVPPPGFYVVDEAGNKVSERFNRIEDAMRKLLELEAEKTRKKDTGQER